MGGKTVQKPESLYLYFTSDFISAPYHYTEGFEKLLKDMGIKVRSEIKQSPKNVLGNPKNKTESFQELLNITVKTEELS